MVHIEQEKSIEFQRTIEKVKKNLKARIGKVVTAKQVIEQKIEITVVKLMNQKQEIIEKFDDMIQQIKDESQDVYTTFDEDVSTMRENLVLLQSLEENVNRDNAETYEEIINKLETVAGIEETVCIHFSGCRTYTWHEYTESQASEETFYGDVMKEEINVALSDLDGMDVQRTIPLDSQLKCQGKFANFFFQIQSNRLLNLPACQMTSVIDLHCTVPTGCVVKCKGTK